MEVNVGAIERLARAIISTVIIFAYLKGVRMLKGMLGGILLVVAGALLPSVLSGYCPVYELLGINTVKKTK
ncbi:MAG: DUF2892 domain-containing protein [Deltaproteobacteria bacterium]|nr:DUF2892 domain-containing protein [Deltaproteobacteria bacterium]